MTPKPSALQTVRPEWIDFNGHLNMAYYNVLFDTSVDEAYEALGFGPAYQKTGCTTYVAEFHVCYLRELHEGDQVYCTFRLIDFDAKRFHCYQELWHVDGWRAATAEGLTLHVDQSGPRVAPMPDHIQQALADWQATQDPLPEDAKVGRRIGIPKPALQTT